MDNVKVPVAEATANSTIERNPNIEKWMPLWFNDFSHETRRMTTLQIGAYVKLITECWLNGCQLPDDDKELAASLV